MFHSVALILIGLLANSFTINLNKPGYLMLLGILLFSGSLYALSLSGIKTLGMVTPLGAAVFCWHGCGWQWRSIAHHTANALGFVIISRMLSIWLFCRLGFTPL